MSTCKYWEFNPSSYIREELLDIAEEVFNNMI